MYKNVVLPYPIFLNRIVSGAASVISSVAFISYVDGISIDLQWTGKITGSFSVEVSNTSALTKSSAPVPTQWTQLPLAPIPEAVGSWTGWYLNINQLSSAFLRVNYSNSTGSGVLTGYLVGKSLG